MAFSATAGKQRTDLPGGMGWMLVDRKANTAVMVMDEQKSTMAIAAGDGGGDDAGRAAGSDLHAEGHRDGGRHSLHGRGCGGWTGQGTSASPTTGCCFGQSPRRRAGRR